MSEEHFKATQIPDGRYYLNVFHLIKSQIGVGPKADGESIKTGLERCCEFQLDLFVLNQVGDVVRGRQ